MIYSIDCTARVNAQDPDYPTYKKIDCTAHCNANENWHGKIINCTATITSMIVTACKSLDQGIRLVVTIDDIDVSESLIGDINIQHNKNLISTFLLNLGGKQYSPRINSHIGLDKVVVITAYINGQEKKLFTGSTDEPGAEDTPAFRVIVPGRDYGKKLLDKVTTLVSIQDLASSKKRNDLIKYLAEQAEVTAVDIPEMDEVTIDNSFQDQSIWDMIQKEAMVELYWVSHNEDGKLELKLDEIKSDEELYPTPDWIYDEDKITIINYKTSRVEINKITVLGKTTQRRIPHTTTTMTDPGGEYLNIPTPIVLFSDSLSFDEGEIIDGNSNLNYTKKVGDIILKINSYGYSAGGGNVHICIGCESQSAWESYIVTSKIATIGGSATLRDNNPSNNYSMGGTVRLHGTLFVVTRQGTGTNYERGKEGYAFTFEVTIYGYKKIDLAPAIPATQETTTTYEIRYDQISAEVSDPNSIEKYGERDGGSIEYPLLETVEQCIAVGRKIIRFNHKLGIADIEIPFNPLAKPGHTVTIINRKIGLTERYLADGVAHRINIDEDGRIKARTNIGGIYYAS